MASETTVWWKDCWTLGWGWRRQGWHAVWQSGAFLSPLYLYLSVGLLQQGLTLAVNANLCDTVMFSLYHIWWKRKHVIMLNPHPEAQVIWHRMMFTPPLFSQRVLLNLHFTLRLQLCSWCSCANPLKVGNAGLVNVSPAFVVHPSADCNTLGFLRGKEPHLSASFICQRLGSVS